MMECLRSCHLLRSDRGALIGVPCHGSLQSRREKVKLFLKGSKCDGPKCPIESRPYPPGQHGRARSKDSEYLLQMREKQKCARIYGVLEKQFRGYYEEANRKQGKTGENLLVIYQEVTMTN